MKKTIFFILFLLCFENSSHANLLGDPFADGFYTDTTNRKEQIEENTIKDNQTKNQNSLQLGAFIESRNQIKLSKISQPLSLRQTVHVETLWKSPYNLTLFASTEAVYEGATHSWDYAKNTNKHDDFTASIHELYLTYDSEHIDVFLGKKIHRWGTGDGINPMDLINPLDTENPIATGRADNRLPSWLACVIFTFDTVSLELVALPYPAVNTMPEFGNPWQPSSFANMYSLINAGLWTESTDSFHLGDSPIEFGGRISWQAQGFDISLMYFQGLMDNPIYSFVNTNNTVHALGEYKDFSAYGLAFAKGFGSQTIRGEFSYKPDYPIQSKSGFERADLWQMVLGWDYDIQGKYYINGQIFADKQNQKDATEKDFWHGLAYELSSLWLYDALKLGIRGKIYTSGDGALTELFSEYTINDNWKCALGFLFFDGSADTIIGQYNTNDAFYLTVRYSF